MLTAMRPPAQVVLHGKLHPKPLMLMPKSLMLSPVLILEDMQTLHTLPDQPGA